MLCVDVNVLVYAHRSDLPEHDPFRRWWETAANGEEPVGVPDVVLSGFLRLVTNRRVFVEPTPTEQAWEQVDALSEAPSVVRLSPGERHWDLFRSLAAAVNANGNDLPDAYLAAYAVEHNATWISADRGFARFERLRWRHPLA